MLRRSWPVLVAVLLVIGTLAVRSTVEQVRAFDDGKAAEEASEPDRAIAEYRWALRWYTPWGPRLDAAAARLVAIADGAEADNPERAARALDALRSGLIAGRSLWQPRADLVAMAGDRIPPILARVAERQGRTEPREALEARMRAAYARPVGVAPLTSAAVSLGFLAWVSGLVWFVRRGVDAQAHLVRPTALRALALAAAGFVTWIGAMWLG